MKTAYSFFKFILCNGTLTLSILVFTLFILDKFNPGIGFMTLPTAKIFIFLLAIFALIYTIISVVESVTRDKKRPKE